MKIIKVLKNLKFRRKKVDTISDEHNKFEQTQTHKVV